MAKFTLALAFLALASIAQGQGLKLPMVAYGVINVADIATTAHALRTVPGAYESNPLLQGSNARRIALKSVTTSGVLVLSSQLEKRGHGRAAKVLLYSLSAVTGAVVVNNMARVR